MSDNFETPGFFTLSYNTDEGDSVEVRFKEPLTWPETLQKFLQMMSMINGYDLTDQVAIKHNPWALNRDYWNGPIFGEEDQPTSAGLSD